MSQYRLIRVECCCAIGDNSGAAVQPGFAGILSGLGRGRGWPMQCSQLHQIAVNYSRTHCNVQRSVNLITPWKSGRGGACGDHPYFQREVHACIVVFRCHILPLCAFLSPAASPCFSQWEALINQRTNCICIKSHSHTDRTANTLDFHFVGFLCFHHTTLVVTRAGKLDF